jgi:cytochrome c oxidase subunit 3
METVTTTANKEHIDYTGSKLGMWLFLLTEILLFGGMFLLYAVYRARYSFDFHAAAAELDTVIGALNTGILLTSSLTMALSIAAIQKKNRRLSLVCQVVTILLAFAFLFNKYLEWGAKIHHGIYPGSPELLSHSKGHILFYSLYYVMRGLHGFHVVAGIVVLFIMLCLTIKGTIYSEDYVKLENSGLYWHLVDIVWIYLFPLFYLIT